MTRILIIGATSTIAAHCARLWAANQAEIILSGRNASKLEAVAADLTARGGQRPTCHGLDVTDVAAQRSLMEAVFADGKTVEIALVAHGILPDESACDADPGTASGHFTTNATSTIALVSALAARMRAQGKGTIAVISSVAGDRGRASNAHYGAAKAAVSIFCDGLRARLRGSGVHVLTIKPGMVATPMTARLDLPLLLVASPTRIARDICRAIDRKKATLYTPWWWGWIMFMLRLVPEPLFVRLKL